MPTAEQNKRHATNRLATGRATIAEADAQQARAERDELQRAFDLMWAADQRAIKDWQRANPGNDLTWPDRKKLTAWLLTERDAALKWCGRLEGALRPFANIAKAYKGENFALCQTEYGSLTVTMLREAEAALADAPTAVPPPQLLEAAKALLSRKQEGPSEDAHIFAEWDDLEDAIKAAEEAGPGVVKDDPYREIGMDQPALRRRADQQSEGEG